MTVRHDGLSLRWFGYATARVAVDGGPTVYADPGRYGVLTGDWEPDCPEGADAHPAATDHRAEDGNVG